MPRKTHKPAKQARRRLIPKVDARVMRSPRQVLMLSRAAVLDVIPTNWSDGLLTGPNATLSDNAGHWGCLDIERLLIGIRDRIEKLPATGKI